MPGPRASSQKWWFSFGITAVLVLALLAVHSTARAGAAGGPDWGDPIDSLEMYSFGGIPFADLGSGWESGFEGERSEKLVRTDGPVTAEIVPEDTASPNRLLRLRAHGKAHAVTLLPERFMPRADHFWRLRLRVRVRGPEGVGAYLRLRNEPLANGQPTALGRREAFHPLTQEWAWVGLADVAPAGADRMSFELRIPEGCSVEVDALSFDTEAPRGWARRVKPGAVTRPAEQDRRGLAGARVRRDTPVEVKDGYWYGLPAGLEPVANSGFFSLGNGLPAGFQVAVAHVFWRQVEPEEGRFDFRSFAESAALGTGFGVRFKTAEAERWPAWLEQRHGLRTFPVIKGGRPALEPWNPTFIEKYEAVYRGLKAAGWIDDARLRFWLFGGISASLGEENHFGEEAMARFERDGTLTPERFRAWLFGRIDFLAELFGAQVGKCTLMTTGRGFPGEYGEIATEAFEAALARGFGLRGGHIENFLQFAGESRIGLRVDQETGRLWVDEAHPFQQGRAFYNECENWTDDRVDAAGTPAERPYRYRQSIFSSLYQRYQYMGMNADMLRRFPAVSRYIQLTLGRRATNSPDAFAYLRESFCRPYGRVVNWERWLVQRENPGSVAIPGLMARRSRMGISDPARIAFDFEGRSTDLERGQFRFDFDADPRVFGAASGPVEVYVTYWDEGGSKFAVYAQTHEGLEKSEPVTVGMKRGFRTVRIRFPSLDSGNRLWGNFDVSLVVENDRNLVVTLVRVAKAGPAAAGEAGNTLKFPSRCRRAARLSASKSAPKEFWRPLVCRHLYIPS